MANPASPREANDTTGTKLGYGIWSNAGTATAVLWRIVNAAVVGAETTRSGAVAIAAQTVHDAADPSAEGPVKIGGYASTAVPSAVSAAGDRVNAWYTLNGAAAATLVPHTVGGLSTFMASGSDGSTILVATAQAVKASAGQVYAWQMYNPEAAVTFVHFYNTAQGSVTVGTTNPLFTIPIVAGGTEVITLPMGIAFSTAITVAATTTAGGNTAPTTGVSAQIWYA